MIGLQQAADAQAAARLKRSQLGGLTLDIAITDASEALVGIPGDLSGNTQRTSLVDILTYKDRLRGLGVLCIALALSGIAVDYIMASSAGFS